MDTHPRTVRPTRDLRYLQELRFGFILIDLDRCRQSAQSSNALSEESVQLTIHSIGRPISPVFEAGSSAVSAGGITSPLERPLLLRIMLNGKTFLRIFCGNTLCHGEHLRMGRDLARQVAFGNLCEVLVHRIEIERLAVSGGFLLNSEFDPHIQARLTNGRAGLGRALGRCGNLYVRGKGYWPAPE